MTESIPEKGKKVAVGMSGGVDSSVAALLLKKQGYEVTGVYIKCWEAKANGCASDENKAYALQTALKLGIKFKELNFIKEYKEKVIEYFYNEYECGRTPNPDVVCNKEIKFGLFFDWAMENGFDYVATGHYAGIKEEDGTYYLLKGKDEKKDQSYFLYLLDQKQLEKILFPLYEYKKPEVRKIAKEAGLPSAGRPDSMGICFVGEVDIKEFLEERIKHKKGNVVNTKGEIIGTHDGVEFFTIGQRHGFEVKKYTGKPLYVVEKDIKKNILVVGEEKECYRNEFEIGDSSLWEGDVKSYVPAATPMGVRIRHLGQIYPCVVEGNKVKLKKLAFGVAPGQSAVFYSGNKVLGGGIIQ